ncbi:hypothetical protein [Thalassotalea sp. PS06]|uniref:hypothetical protein n=1 Tax=Thalassotalea sp. PS06 TaxID=2594005 RepID=UPI001161D5AF|nr:hypothetical protein [Thalassotalea sp. PS06]QDP00648.1 hypothetical protein FNC98_04335 [Thalassotalea sp. PS06]
MQQVSLNNSKLRLLLEAEYGLLYCATTHSLRKLEPIGVSLLLAIDLGLDEHQCCEDIIALNQTRKDDIQKLYRTLFDIYHSTSDLSESTDSMSTSVNTHTRYGDGIYLEVQQLQSIETKNLHSENFHQGDLRPDLKRNLLNIDTGQCIFQIDCQQPKLAADLRSLFKPLINTTANNSNLPRFSFEIKKRTHTETNRFESQPGDTTFDFYSNGHLVLTDLLFEHIAAVLIERMQIITFQISGFRFCFHGAALSKDKHLFLLPGKSGVGKSTLTAYLANRGFTVHSDEMITLDEDFRVLSIRMPVAIKSGAWETVTKQYPQLLDAPVWQLLDGREVKYIWTDSQLQADLSVESVFSQHQHVHFIAPNYRLGVSADAVNQSDVNSQPLTVIDTIETVTKGGYQVGKELLFKDVAELSSYIQNASREILTYSSSEQAYSWIENLFNK